VRGDLDWIVMKALEKDRARRYDTASALLEDVQHHLSHEPVKAGPPGAAYRARKFVRRHRAGLAVGTALGALLLAGAIVSSWQAVRATRAEREEKKQRQEAEQQARIAKNERTTADKERQRAERTSMRMELRRAEDAFGADNSSLGLAYLAWVMRKDPTNQAVAERILSALTYRSFPLPAFGPLQHDRPIRFAGFSPRGDRVVTASDDRTARVWSTANGQP